jgi:hypothetical protein
LPGGHRSNRCRPPEPQTSPPVSFPR